MEWEGGGGVVCVRTQQGLHALEAAALEQGSSVQVPKCRLQGRGGGVRVHVCGYLSHILLLPCMTHTVPEADKAGCGVAIE